MKDLLKIVLLLLLIAVCYWTFSSQLEGLVWTSCTDLQQRFLALGIWAPLLIYVGFLASAVAIIPGTLLTMFSGLSFGLFWGTALALVGVNSGAFLAFFLTRSVGRRTVERVLHNKKWFLRLKASMENAGLEYIIFVRLVPLFPFTGLNFACGLLPVRSIDFILGSLIGTLPGTFVYVYLGRTGCQIMELVLKKNIRLEDLPVELRWHLGLAVLLLGFLSLIPLLWRHHSRRKSTD